MLHQGKIIAEAPPKEFQQLDDPRVQQFIHGKAEGPLSEEEVAHRPEGVGGKAGEADEADEADEEEPSN